MGIMIGPEGMKFELPQLIELVEVARKKGKDTFNRLSKKLKDRRIEDFLGYRQFLIENRRIAAVSSSLYYENGDSMMLTPDIPIMYRRGWIPPDPIDLGKVELKFSSHKKFDFHNSIYVKEKILPLRFRRYSRLQKKFVQKVLLRDDPVYRLMEIEGSEGKLVLKFGLDSYYNYIDTCELIAFEFCKQFARKVKNIDRVSATSLRKKFVLKLRSQVDPFDFDNRTAAAGINTVLILIDTNGRSTFFVHQRSTEKLAEAINTLHVVPAGTFQPRHKGYITKDFKMYNNLMREFGEELLGQEEFQEMTRNTADIFDVQILKRYSLLIKKGLGKVYFLGIGLDCLTLKPEILTALVLDKEAVDVFLGGCNFMDNFEGEHMEADFTREALDLYIRDERTLPAGAACFYLVKRNFDFIQDTFK